MSDSKKKAAPKKVVEKKKEEPKKATPKKQVPKKTAHTSLGSLKKEYFAAIKANPADAAALRTQYKKDRKALRGTLKSKK